MAKSRKYYVICLGLIVCAICAESVSKKYVSDSVVAIAKRTIATDAEKLVLKRISEKSLRNAYIVWPIGALLALSGFVFWMISIKHKEPVWELIPGALLFCYVLMQFLMV